MKNILFLIAIMICAASCKKECKHNPPVDLCAEPEIGIGDCITDSNQVKPLILGKWNWTQTIPGWSVTKKNPCTENLNYTYEFLNNGKVKIYVDSIYSSTADYTFMQTWTSEISVTDTSTFSIHPEIYNANGAVRICGNYLIIDNSPVDGPRITFLREN